MKNKFTLFLMGLLVLLSACKKETPVVPESDFVKSLRTNARIHNIRCYKTSDITPDSYGEYVATINNLYKECIEFDYIQPVDHNNPTGQTFYQRVRIFYAGSGKNTVLHTAGYNLSKEMAVGFNSLSLWGGMSLVEVEHRYFLGSNPSTIDTELKYFNAVQQSADLHDIVTDLRSLMGGKWISTGCSKDGITTALYAMHYPKDMNVYVPFDAPFCQSRDDMRNGVFLKDKVGTAAERKRIFDSQTMALDMVDDIAKYVYSNGEGKGSTEIPSAKVEAYRDSVKCSVVMRFVNMWCYTPVSEWINMVPEKGGEGITADSLYRYYYRDRKNDSGPGEDDVYQYPYYLQAWFELGFYSLDLSGFDPKYQLSNEKHGVTLKSNISDEDLAHYGSRPFDNTAMKGVVDFVKNTGGAKMVFVYGGNDHWTASGIQDGEFDVQNVRRHLITRGTHTDNLDSFEIRSEAEAVWSDIMSFLQ